MIPKMQEALEAALKRIDYCTSGSPMEDDLSALAAHMWNAAIESAEALLMEGLFKHDAQAAIRVICALKSQP